MGETLPVHIPSFNRSIRIEAREDRLTSDSGALLLREAMERLDLLNWLTKRLTDPRDQAKVVHPLRELLATSLLLLAQGWRDQDDADELRKDPGFLVAASEKRGMASLRGKNDNGVSSGDGRELKGLPSQPTLSRLIELLSLDTNRHVLRKALVVSAGRRIRGLRGHRHHRVILDIDSLPVEVAGHQKGSKYNGHYHKRIYHPLVASLGGTGDLVDLRLRPGNVHTANGALEFIEPLVELLKREVCMMVAVRIDAGFPEERLCSSLEQGGTHYVARIRNNATLNRMANPYLDRHTGSVKDLVEACLAERGAEEPRTWLYEERYQAGSWSRERRVVLVVQERPGELFPHHFWLLTSWEPQEIHANTLLGIYQKRGCAEGLMGELMDVLEPALSSANRSKSHYRGQEPRQRKQPRDTFAANEVLLLLNALAYNVMHMIRTLLEVETKEGWSLKRIRERVLKVAGRFLIHARYITVVIAHSSARYWDQLWKRLERFQLPPPLPEMS